MKEEKYHKDMEGYNKQMEGVEKQFKGLLENKIMLVLKQVEAEKAKYDKAQGNVADLSESIKNFASKFDALKDEVSNSGKKYEQYKEQIDLKMQCINLLETETKNVLLLKEKYDKTKIEIEKEKRRARNARRHSGR